MNITTTIIRGQACKFLSESFVDDKYMRGGRLAEPVTFEIGGHTLTFTTLDLCSDSENIHGGILAFPHILEIGRNKNKIPALSVYFYYGCEEIESILIAVDTPAKVGLNNYVFAAGDATDGYIYFHPNGEIMRADLAEPAHILLDDTTFISQTVGFWEDNRISGLIPLYNTWYQGFEFLGGYGNHSQCKYSLSFTQSGKLSWGVLSNGNQISFPES